MHLLKTLGKRVLEEKGEREKRGKKELAWRMSKLPIYSNSLSRVPAILQLLTASSRSVLQDQ